MCGEGVLAPSGAEAPDEDLKKEQNVAAQAATHKARGKKEAKRGVEFPGERR